MLSLSTNVFSATATSSFGVTATVSSSCSVSSASTLAFGSYNPLSGTQDATTTISATCTNGTAYTVSLDAGTGSGATVATRLMTRTAGGSETLSYTIYQDSNRTTVWGNTIGVNTVAGTGNGSAQSLIAYGRIFSSNTTVPPASYSDTIGVTLTY